MWKDTEKRFKTLSPTPHQHYLPEELQPASSTPDKRDSSGSLYPSNYLGASGFGACDVRLEDFMGFTAFRGFRGFRRLGGSGRKNSGESSSTSVRGGRESGFRVQGP